jgi:hypothetical protein
MTSLMESRDGLSERLAAESYDRPALVPAAPWLGTAAPGQPVVSVRSRTALGTELEVAPIGTEEVFHWTVRSRIGQQWTSQVVPGWKRMLTLPGNPEQIVVTAVGRTGNEGPAAVLTH